MASAPDGDARRGFAGAGALQNVAGVVEIVLDGAGEVGMAGTRAGDRLLLILSAFGIFHRKRLGPVLPVPVANEDGDGRADGVRMAHAGDDLGAVGLDLHAPAAAVALLAAPELAVDGVEGHWYAGGESGQRGHKAFAVGLAGGFKSQHAKTLMLAGERREGHPGVRDLTNRAARHRNYAPKWP